jgi:hypothetical protein
LAPIESCGVSFPFELSTRERAAGGVRELSRPNAPACDAGLRRWPSSDSAGGRPAGTPLYVIAALREWIAMFKQIA